jgi:hypothetical protein
MALIIAALQARPGIEAGRWTEKDMAGVVARSRAAARGSHRRMGHQSPHPLTTSTKRRRAKLAPGGHEQINLIRTSRTTAARGATCARGGSVRVLHGSRGHSACC